MHLPSFWEDMEKEYESDNVSVTETPSWGSGLYSLAEISEYLDETYKNSFNVSDC